MTPSIFLIDMDDTLYDERDYIDAGYRAAAEALSSKTNLTSEALFARLTYEHQKYGRHQVFNRLCEYAEIENPDYRNLVKIYREAPRSLDLYPGAKSALKTLRAIAPVVVVTDGATAMQEAKVEALKLGPLVDDVVYCWQCKAPKPEKKSFSLAIKKFKAHSNTAIVVGDDPYHDGFAAQALGSNFCRVRTGKYSAVNIPGLIADIDIETFDKLPEYLIRA